MNTLAKGKAVYALNNLVLSSVRAKCGVAETYLRQATGSLTDAGLMDKLAKAKLALAASEGYRAVRASNPTGAAFNATRVGRAWVGINEGIRLLIPPAPAPAATVPAIFDHYVFAGRLSNFSGAERGQAWARGYNTILVQMDASDVGAANREELQNHGAAYRAEGWALAGWSAPMTGDPRAWAERDVASVHEFDFLGWGANWEEWGEGPNRPRANAWVREWTLLGSPCPLLLSCLSSETPNFARDFNYDPFVEIGAAVGPQVYGDVHAGYTVFNMVETMKRGGVPVGLLAPTFGGVGPLDPYADYATWAGPRGAWIAGQVRDWGAL